MWSPSSALLALLLLPGPALAEAAEPTPLENEPEPVASGQLDDITTEKPKTQTVLSNSEPAPEPAGEEPLLGLPLQQPAAAADSEAVVKLQGANFAEVTSGPGNTFVKFYAPWCGHCEEMAPEWEELAEHFQQTPIPGL
jgi:thiol-disulfide isomerase/thioredoxin